MFESWHFNSLALRFTSCIRRSSLAWYDPNAPAWTQTTYQLAYDAGVRLGYAF